MHAGQVSRPDSASEETQREGTGRAGLPAGGRLCGGEGGLGFGNILDSARLLEVYLVNISA